MNYLPASALAQVYITTFVAILGLFGFLNVVGTLSKSSTRPAKSWIPGSTSPERLARNLMRWAQRMLWALPVCTFGVAYVVFLAVGNFERDALGAPWVAGLRFCALVAGGLWLALGVSVLGIVVAVLREPPRSSRSKL